ncbi:hypothetical protein BLOT_013543 [Blomia tropicalis]|nr:hypothetical protein BLOT_013543 [Blomia tropicalis]
MIAQEQTTMIKQTPITINAKLRNTSLIIGSLNKVYAIDKNLKLCCEGNGNTCRKRVEQMELLAKIDEKNERR